MAALQAGVMNVPFAPVRGLLHTDYMRIRPDFKEIPNPYDPAERIAIVPAIAPTWPSSTDSSVIAPATWSPIPPATRGSSPRRPAA
jgi:hypothetical protein